MSAPVQSVMVVGAGVIGLSCGYNLAQKGLDVTIVEENLPGSGQSTKTGGGIRYFHGLDENVEMSFLSQGFWKKFRQTLDIDPYYRETGHLFLTSNFQVSKDLFNIPNQKSLKLEMLEKTQIQVRWPQLSGLNLQYGVYCPFGGYLDHHKVIKGLVKGFESLGGVIRLGVRVISLIKFKDKVIGVRTSNGPLTANVILNCAGAMVSELTQYEHTPDPFRSRHHELIIVKPKRSFTDVIPWLIDIDNQVHLRPDGEGRALVGGFLGKNKETDIRTYSYDISHQWCEEVLKAAHSSFGLTPTNTDILHHWGGLYPGTLDYKPVIEKTKAGFYTAAGFAGTGLMHAPATGIIVCDLITNGQTDKIEISKFSSARFIKSPQVMETTGF